MTPVNQEDVKTSKIVSATMPWEGPFSRLPLRRRMYLKAGRTAYTKKRHQPMQTSNTHKAASPDPLFTSATQRANRIHPVTSLPTPAARTVTPTGVAKSFNSVRILQRTGKAVIYNGCQQPRYRDREMFRTARAVPTNSI